MGKRMNRKGDTLVIETVVFVLFNLIFFVGMLFYIYNAGNQNSILEQTYAKQIALLIDNAKPDSTIYVNIDKLISVANSNGVRPENIVRIDEANKRVIVSLVDKKGYSMQYYSDYSLALTSANIVRIYVKEKGAA
jgi:cbb3-type cytochrome oxidase subunit 3